MLLFRPKDRGAPLVALLLVLAFLAAVIWLVSSSAHSATPPKAVFVVGTHNLKAGRPANTAATNALRESRNHHEAVVGFQEVSGYRTALKAKAASFGYKVYQSNVKGRRGTAIAVKAGLPVTSAYVAYHPGGKQPSVYLLHTQGIWFASVDEAAGPGQSGLRQWARRFMNTHAHVVLLGSWPVEEATQVKYFPNRTFYSTSSPTVKAKRLDYFITRAVGLNTVHRLPKNGSDHFAVTAQIE